MNLKKIIDEYDEVKLNVDIINNRYDNKLDYNPFFKYESKKNHIGYDLNKSNYDFY